MRYARKLDANHADIKDELLKRGYHVCDMSASGKYPDLLVWRKDVTAWVENKIPGSRAKWTRVQLQYIADTPMPVVVALSPQDAFERLKAGRYITQRAKDAIAALLHLTNKKYFQPSEIASAINS